MKAQPTARSILKRLLIDILLTGIALVIFALFHHVLPRQMTSIGTVIENPYKHPAETENSSFLQLPDDSMLLAASGTTGDVLFSDGTVLSASSGKSRPGSSQQNRSRQNSGGNSKGGSALDETSTEAEDSADAEDSTPIWEKFEDRFTDEIIITDTSYTSPDISITVSEETLQNGRITYYLADIYLRDVTCFQSVLAGDTYGKGFRDSIPDMATLSNALIAINGDYYGNTSEGVVIRNGVIYRANPTNCDVCVLYYDGSMRVMPGSAFSVKDAIAQGAWQAWTFGPALLDTDGNILTDFDSTGRIIAANPRTAIGYYEKGHYCMVVVDGRGDSAGITLPDLSQLFYDLGCTAAYNLDGGNSSVMVWQQDVVNQPSGGGRESSDALLITEVTQYE